MIRIILYPLLGAVGGYGYHLLMRCVGSQCINRRFPAVPITIGIVAGIAAAIYYNRK